MPTMTQAQLDAALTNGIEERDSVSERINVFFTFRICLSASNIRSSDNYPAQRSFAASRLSRWSAGKRPTNLREILF